MRERNTRAIAKLISEYKEAAGIDTSLETQLDTQIKPDTADGAESTPGVDQSPLIKRSDITRFLMT